MNDVLLYTLSFVSIITSLQSVPNLASRPGISYALPGVAVPGYFSMVQSTWFDRHPLLALVTKLSITAFPIRYNAATSPVKTLSNLGATELITIAFDPKLLKHLTPSIITSMQLTVTKNGTLTSALFMEGSVNKQPVNYFFNQ